MAKKGPDFQQLLLQHGERIGLGIAGGLSVLLLVFSLFMPGSGITSGSPEEKEKALTTLTDSARRKMNDPNNVPGDNDKPDKDSDKKIIALDTSSVEGDPFRLAALVPITSDGALGRRVPKVFPVDEGLAAFRHIQVQSFIFGDNGNVVYALESKSARPGMPGMGGGPPTAGGGGRGGGGPGSGPGGLLGNLLGGGGGGAGMPGMPSMPGMPGMPPNMPGGGDASGGDFKVVQIRLTDWEKRANSVIPAQQIEPLRMAIIAGSFPLKKQIEEFQNKLGLRTVEEVLGEMSLETDPQGQPLNAFRFLGVNVQRRELDGDGNPKGDFVTLDLVNDYKPYAIRTGLNFQEEDPELSQILIPGLYMRRLKQFRKEDVSLAGVTGPGSGGGGRGSGGEMETEGGRPGMMSPGMPGMAGVPGMPGRPGMPGGPGVMGAAGKDNKEQYPPLEKELANIKKTLEALKAKNVEVPRIAERFSGDRFDPFAPADSNRGGNMDGGYGGPGGMMPGGTAGMMPGRPGPGGGRPGGVMPPRGMMPGMPGSGEMGPGPGPGGMPGQELEIPAYAPVRLLDVTVQPGKTYEYRLQIRMANPNYRRKDVASVAYATDKELLSEWSKVPIRVTIPPELRYYAIDQQEVEKAENPRAQYRDRYTFRPTGPINKEREVVLQVHRWLERATTGGGSEMIVGDWAVAERLPVYRGEYVGRRERIELPVWRYASMNFVIASDSATSKVRKGIDVHFGYNAGGAQPEAILVDFQQGSTTYERVLRRTEDGAETRKITDQAATEALILRPDGRLLLIEGALDVNDEERKKVLERVRDHINEVKNKGAAATQPGSGPGGLFPDN